MDNLEKLASLCQQSNETEASKDKNTGASSLQSENTQLKQTLSELLSSASKNQQTQEKFYELELYFLESRTYESLIKRILEDLRVKLRLTQVELVLIDPENEIRHLVEEIYGELDYVNLKYVDDFLSVKPYYQGAIRLELTQQAERIEKLFVNQPKLCKSMAQLPLTRGNQIIGSLHLGSRDVNRFHKGLATNFLQHLSSIISVCIENSINQEKYIHLSLVDMLTRAKNRRYFFQSLAKEIARASRSFAPISCLFIDIDHFKKINDIHGHLVGDRALRIVSEAIIPQLRKSDTLARFGGEEFTVLLPDCDEAHAHEIAERIRHKISAIKVENTLHETFQLTISIGISNWEPSEQQFDNADAIQNYLINTADEGVYLAKKEGRNCVRQAPQKK